MEDEIIKLKERIRGMSNEELLKIVTVERRDYRREAVDLATRELQSRGVPYEPADDIEDDDEGDGSEVFLSDNLPPCHLCGGAMRFGQLFADKELTIFFPDDEEDRFVQAIACSKCGQVRLIVDLETDIEQE